MLIINLVLFQNFEMSLSGSLIERSKNGCELCKGRDELSIYLVSPKTEETEENCALICQLCKEQIEDSTKVNPNHWRCLNDSMWSEVPAVKVLAWRMLNRMIGEGWTADLLDMMYLENDVLTWAKQEEKEEADEKIVHKDSNGAILSNGDSVTVIKDLNVKGSSLVAKRGTAVRNISLVWDNAEQIEGRVEGQQIVILTQYVKKNS